LTSKAKDLGGKAKDLNSKTKAKVESQLSLAGAVTF